MVSKDIKGVRSRYGAIASSTQLQHVHEDVTRVQVQPSHMHPPSLGPMIKLLSAAARDLTHA